jgi:hypothetical protein
LKILGGNMTTNDIVKAVIGALIGLSIPYILKSVVFIFRRFRRAQFEGAWYAYHATQLEDHIEVVSTTWKISKSAMKNPCVGRT